MQTGTILTAKNTAFCHKLSIVFLELIQSKHLSRLVYNKVNSNMQKYSRLRCLLRVKGLVICYYLGWSGSTYSSVQKKYNKGRFKVMATYLQQ